MFELPKLAYDFDELEPYISSETLFTHYNKHHQGYVDKLNSSDYVKKNTGISLEDIIINESGDVFNNAAQVWNHNFYWKCMKPHGGRAPSKNFMEIICKQFGEYKSFISKLKNCALNEFGSGWARVTLDKELKFHIESTTDALNPLLYERIPMLTIDVWEHAYYLDYKNDRKKYIQDFLDNLIDWSFVENQYESVIKRVNDEK